MNKLVVCFAIVALSTGCVTTKSSTREIDRQIKYLESLEKVHAALTDKLAEVGEQIEQGKKDLEAIKESHDADTISQVIENGPESLEQK